MGQRIKSESPTDSNPSFRTRMDALSTDGYENSWRARPFNRVHIWHASCILLGTAMSKSLWLIINEVMMVNFKLGDNVIKMKYST